MGLDGLSCFDIAIAFRSQMTAAEQSRDAVVSIHDGVLKIFISSNAHWESLVPMASRPRLKTVPTTKSAGER